MNREKKQSANFEYVIHILFWLVFIIAPLFLREGPVPPRSGNMVFPGPHPAMHSPLLTLFPVLIIYFYLNYLLFSKWYGQRQYLKFVMWNIITVVAFLGLRSVLELWIWEVGIRNLFFDFLIFLFMFLLSTSITIFKIQNITAKHLRESEISFLRNQINPHFIFNVMNMIVAFSRKYPERVETAVNTLSDILRYMLYDTQDKSKVSHEIMVIEQYLSLQRLRFENEVEIKTSFTLSGKDIMVEPMLLIPIIENAFKHGTSMVSSPVIDISLTTHNGILTTMVRNKYTMQNTTSLSTYSGLGLANIKRRLELLYPGKHEFEEKRVDNEWFVVMLKIDCR
ncbi:MAG: hypothetical protein A2X18_02740 [Bacteroidetes bacterium GWF2_40_14]|nr:MAG: hypothetical protein A2X18_02740 [Bacteroidetes bacterium GWF2_40_14]